jgi:hypothetical protein
MNETGIENLEVASYMNRQVDDLRGRVQQSLSCLWISVTRIGNSSEATLNDREPCELALRRLFLNILEIAEGSLEYTEVLNDIYQFFGSSKLEWTSIVDKFNCLCSCLEASSFENTWTSAVCCQIILVLLFRFQFMGGMPLQLPHEGKLEATQICLLTFQQILKIGKSLDRSRWHSLERYLLKELVTTSKCTSSLIGFRLFLIYSCLESIITFLGPSKLTAVLITNLLSFNDSLDKLFSEKMDRRVLLLPIYDPDNKLFPTTEKREYEFYFRPSRNLKENRIHPSCFFGAQYWNDRVLSQFMEEKNFAPSFDESNRKFSSEPLRNIYFKFCSFNRQLIQNCKFSLKEYFYNWFSKFFLSKLLHSLQFNQSQMQFYKNSLSLEIFANCVRTTDEILLKWKKAWKKKERNEQMRKTFLFNYLLFISSVHISDVGIKRNRTIEENLVSKEELAFFETIQSHLLIYLQLFVLFSVWNRNYLKEICFFLLDEIEKEVLKESIKRHSFFDSLPVIKIVSVYMPLLLLLLSHGNGLLIDGTVINEIILRLLKLVSFRNETFQQNQNENINPVALRQFSIYLLQQVLYLVLHNARLCFVDIPHTSLSQEKEDTRAELAELPNLLFSLLNVYKNSFSRTQWIYLEVFLFPFLDAVDPETSALSSKQTLINLLNDYNPSILIEDEANLFGCSMSSRKYCIVVPLVFELNSYHKELFSSFSREVGNSTYFQAHSFFSIWKESFSNSSAARSFLSNAEGFLHNPRLPNIHEFTYTSLQLFLDKCRQLLFPSWSTSRQSLSLRKVRKIGKSTEDEEREEQFPYFNQVSDEVILIIFSYLNYKRIIKLSALSKCFQQVILTTNLFWKEVYFRTFPRQFFLNNLIAESKLSSTASGKEKRLVQQAMQHPIVETTLANCLQCQKNPGSGKACKVNTTNHLWLRLFKVFLRVVRLFVPCLIHLYFLSF